MSTRSCARYIGAIARTRHQLVKSWPDMTVGKTKIFLIFFFPLLILSGCVEEMTGGEDATRLSSKTVLRRGNGGEPQTLDPARAFDMRAAAAVGTHVE